MNRQSLSVSRYALMLTFDRLSTSSLGERNVVNHDRSFFTVVVTVCRRIVDVHVRKSSVFCYLR